MNKEQRKGLRTWIEIDRKAVAHNFSVFRSLISKKTKLMAVIKSNAYGHSLIDFAREMENLGANFLGVDSIVEGLALRKEGIKTPILVLGYTLPEMVNLATSNNISLSVSNFESLEYIIANQKHFIKPLNIHIKVDTGMHRQGFQMEDRKKLLKILSSQKNDNIYVEGLFTHFASAKNPSFPADTEGQIKDFKLWIHDFKQEGLKPIAHAGATAGALLFPNSHFDMVRIGIGLYGLWPSKETKAALQDKILLKPILSWKSLITEIKKQPKGNRMGYDLTESLAKDGLIAIVPVGYWHGYPRSLSSIGRMIVKGEECKVIGRVSMDMVCIDVSEVKNLYAGDEVVVIGNDSNSSCSMEGISNILDLSWYETITRINPLIKRFYT
ncbi:MAG: alanine racemase [Parcubacteria group bacterium GW2011_GWC1_35_8]|uniref:Alanine racemase n=3 Tax=Candidatus Nomuraibacteriota TaxID=1752729 RepID=A0A1F6YWM9_9BACT|nr:MAG: alanine racemase [Parcubacteria group bacterium GW2011_GWC1_35_8]KKP89579.1 MAG: alanine racemase [Candidatus Nomurabacteria bacterium GW2011_GWC2_35_8]OGJ04755.1 MAG: alanine racemase [Candidatus Nomurabacteria bacterium RIFOXYA2_FULL_35_9]OGJ06593.1 MAG: alanine racemase [Candidatus Nomurabacteria bacterium RIFOXYA1_FULL_35_17]OGJ10743.1 MAG: alanine racemase [Candidatus Nomurabacteria bacterium RIFOXYC2_FULL_36_19]OGJ13936.1 MAG: alanine racemase [Candidatus Nomurabacteria bacterium